MRILVVGAGLAGLTLALYMERNGHETIVLEQSPGLRGAGYMIDFFGSGYDAAERLGLLRELEAIHYPIARLSFLKRDGSTRFDVSYETMRQLLGGRHFNFMRGDLERVLFDNLRRTQVRFGSTVDSFAQQDDGIEVTLSDGSKERTDLLVGADGIHSRIRSLAFGQENLFLRQLGYHTAAFVFADPEMQAEIGDAFATLTVPGLQVALYPIRGGKVATFWVHKSHTAIPHASAEAAAKELRDVYGHLGWLIPKVLDRGASADIYLDTVAQVIMRKWSVGRVVLLGDACHCVSLLAGQGASMALGGAYVLADEMERSKADVPTALTRYEQRLRPAILKKQKAGRNIAGWFVPENRVRLAVRDAVMKMSSSAIGGWILKRQVSGDSVIPRE
jgi:2-polyprenyl-6-methoxyphenol hydroxylase-like FAD-dependent oxidoreductase